LNAAWTYLDAEQRTGTYAGLRVPYASRHQVSGGLRYDWPHTRLSLDGFGFSRSYADAANTVVENATGSVGVMPGYVVFNGQLSHDLLDRPKFRLRGTAGARTSLTTAISSAALIPAPGGAKSRRGGHSLSVCVQRYEAWVGMGRHGAG
jgi:hypothetical protein